MWNSSLCDEIIFYFGNLNFTNARKKKKKSSHFLGFKMKIIFASFKEVDLRQWFLLITRKTVRLEQSQCCSCPHLSHLSYITSVLCGCLPVA